MAEEEEGGVQFVGREKFLQDLQTNWGRYRIFGVFGMKSVGKSRTVIEFLKRLRSNYPTPEKVRHIHVQLQSVSSWQGLVLKIKGRLKDNSMNEDFAIFLDELVRRIETCQDVNFIFDFDDAEDVIESPVKAMFLSLCESLLEICFNVKILVTSTVRIKFPHHMASFYSMELPVMSHNDGVKLLQSVTPHIQYGGVIDEIVKLCLGLPLAILMTGSELEMDGGFVSPKEMVVILTQCRLEAWSREETYSEEERLGSIYKSSIARLTKVFQDRLAVLGYIPGSFTCCHAQEMLANQSLQETKDVTLSPLLRRHMIDYDAAKLRYNIHGILKLCLEDFRTLDKLPEIRKRYCLIFARVMQDIAARVSTRECAEAISELAVEQPNLQKLMLDIAYTSQETYPVYIRLVESSSHLIEQYFGGESVQFYENCLKLCETYKRDTDDAIVSGAYGRSLTNVKGDLLTGEEMYRRALRRSRLAGSYHSILANAAQVNHDIGWNLHLQGRNEEALMNLQEAQYLAEKIGMKDELVILRILSVRGILHIVMGHYEEGEKYHLESLRRTIARYGEMHHHVGSCYNNLGILYMQKGDYSTSNNYYRKGLEVKRETNAPPASIIVSISNVVSVEIMGKDFSAAKLLLDEGAEIVDKQLSQLGSIYVKGLIPEGYGRLYSETGDQKAAIKVLEEQAKHRRNSDFGQDGLVECLLSLGRAHRKAGTKDKAWQVLTELLSQKEAVANNIPQSRFVFGGVIEMVEMMTEDFYSREDNSPSLEELFSFGSDELLRIISYYTERGVFTMRDIYDRKLKEWNVKRRKVNGS